MKTSEIREKSIEELSKTLTSQLEEQFKLRMRASMGQVSQTHEIKQTRRNIARIKTILSEKIKENAGN